MLCNDPVIFVTKKNNIYLIKNNHQFEKAFVFLLSEIWSGKKTEMEISNSNFI